MLDGMEERCVGKRIEFPYFPEAEDIHVDDMLKERMGGRGREFLLSAVFLAFPWSGERGDIKGEGKLPMTV